MASTVAESKPPLTNTTASRGGVITISPQMRALDKSHPTQGLSMRTREIVNQGKCVPKNKTPDCIAVSGRGQASHFRLCHLCSKSTKDDTWCLTPCFSNPKYEAPNPKPIQNSNEVNFGSHARQSVGNPHTHALASVAIGIVALPLSG
jgi:hypothetical protein